MTLSVVDDWNVFLTPSVEQSIYFVLDPVVSPDAISSWSELELASESIPLYIQTPMESMLKASPWLMKVKPEKSNSIIQWLHEHEGIPWGWAYASPFCWFEQCIHWRQYLRILIENDLKVVRFQDPRVLGIWLALQRAELWHGLLATVTMVKLFNSDIYYRMVELASANDRFPWSLPREFSDAWYSSEFGIKVQASNFEILLWEEHADLAEAAYQQGGDLMRQLEIWLADLAQKGGGSQQTEFYQVTEWLQSMHQQVTV
ncbi:DUF4123 domain-containing protein [Aeromonas sp. sia0103]|uniref:DUF4123 domain-containing protein n=1 Tax=Aeromonas sp. sia0103 TaxID=2854782 RepID=UPI001C4915A5|nr:DUF4123 domain-containing protein [Aeromonas sp. sia0103]MBV7597498.1 DUF4123 domain-containing protein [Aeromonas sp. sia0103]